MYPYPQQKNFTPFPSPPTMLPPLFTLHPHRYLAQCVKCYDADSIHAVIHFHGTPTRFRCRLLGIDTPEIRSKDPAERTHARAARDFLREGILGKYVVLSCGDFDKYGRLLVWVHTYEPNQAQLFGVEGMDLLEAQEGVDTDAKHVQNAPGGSLEAEMEDPSNEEPKKENTGDSEDTEMWGYTGSWNERLVNRGFGYRYDGGKRKAFGEWFVDGC